MRNVRVILVDNIDLNTPADTTRTFAVGNTAYSLDLTNEHAAEFDADMARWIDKADKQGRVLLPGARVTPKPDTSATAPADKPWYRHVSGQPEERNVARRKFREKALVWVRKNLQPSAGDRLARDHADAFLATPEGQKAEKIAKEKLR